MGRVRPLGVRGEWRGPNWTTRRNRAAVVRHLDLLAVALKPKGYRCIKLYRADQFPVPLSLLWVFACGTDNAVGVAVGVRAIPGNAWGYYEATRGRHGYLSPCGDSKTAAEQVDSILKHRMFPGSW
ncbi:hypothetical protein [Actinomadura sediminis]|uniref:Uncharacterized protein n=1 Tax=Actinomadura sediminis TaxID=1038904 RepID=A0ABW3ERC9_9ACTN